LNPRDGETEVEVTLSGRDPQSEAQRIKEGKAVRTRARDNSIEYVTYETNRYEDAWPINSGVLQTTGLMKFVSPGPDFVPGRYEDSDHILVFAERSGVVLDAYIVRNGNRLTQAVECVVTCYNSIQSAAYIRKTPTRPA
jgi:hypothetical protein